MHPHPEIAICDGGWGAEMEQDEKVAVLAFCRPTDLIGLLSRNQLLNLLTFRLYRFWARTNLRRALWSAVAIDGEPLLGEVASRL